MNNFVKIITVKLPAWSFLLVILIGVIALLGWLFDILTLQSIYRNYYPSPARSIAKRTGSDWIATSWTT